MASKTVLIWPDFFSYHLARLESLYKKMGNMVLGIEIRGAAGEDESIQWRQLDHKGLPIVTLFPETNFCEHRRKAIGRLIIGKLKEVKAENVFINGYSNLEYQMIINWARKSGKKCFTFFETKKDDFPRTFLKEWLKRKIVRRLDGALCGGRLHREYAIELGIHPDKAVVGYDVVDNDFFSKISKVVRENPNVYRSRYGLPERYFLTVSRFIQKKNILGLLDAYNTYRKQVLDGDPWQLILCGAGSLENSLKRKVKVEDISGVHFLGFRQPDELAIFYALSSSFILASTVEQWGLVINEAMASGVPVLSSRVAGAARELIIEGETGFTFDPMNMEDISSKMIRYASLPDEKRAQMGSAAQRLVCEKFPLDLFAKGVLQLIGSN